jgi:hypothetical protein
MKLSKKKLFILITGLLFLTIIIASSFLLINQKSAFNPISDKNNFYDQLNLALKTGHLETSSLIIRDFLNQVEFTVKNDNNTFKVIVSNQKNPLNQIASLQELIKTAKMKGQYIKLVDLSVNHPYATFKNN